MSTQELLVERMKQLPEPWQMELLQYAEYLNQKYAAEQEGKGVQDANADYAEWRAEILNARLASYKANPSQVIPAQQADDDIYKTFGWKKQA